MSDKEDERNVSGFLNDTEAWSEEVARRIAEEEGLEDLNDDRREIIEELRKYHEDHGMLPSLRQACKTAKENDRPCLSESFDGDPVKAVKAAGLPQPAGEVLTHYRRTCCRR